MATARKDFDPAAFDPGADLLSLVTGLELLALVGIVDPPRPTARTSIATARAAGFGAMSDEEALAKIDEIGVIAVSPPSTRSAWSRSSGSRARSSR